MSAAVGQPPGCLKALVSTVDPSWGRLRFSFAPGCPQGDGYIIVKRDGTDWRSVLQIPAENGPCPVRPIPTRVARDLVLCRKPKAYLLCLPNKTSERREVREKPRRCTTLGPRNGFSDSVNLVKVRWRGWGRRVARGRGIERGFKLPLTRIRVRLTAYRRRHVCGGDYLYTRLKARSRYGVTVVKLPRRCGD